MAAWTLVSKEEVTQLTSHAQTKLQDIWSLVCEALIRQHLSLPYLGEEVNIENEYHSGTGNLLLLVRYPPIVSVTKLLVNTRAAIPADYVIFPNYIHLKNQVFPEGNLNIIVSYVSGGESIDDPILKLCEASMIAAIVNYHDRYGADSTLKWATEELEDRSGGGSTPNLNVGLTSHLTQIMRRLLRKDKLRFG